MTIIGAGTMGNGIAQVFAQNGFEVCVLDPSEKSLARAKAKIENSLDRLIKKERISGEQKNQALSNLHFTSTVQDAFNDSFLVVEAVSEDKDLKYRIFKEWDQRVSGEAILATNTSSISITEIAAQTTRPERVIGMHFMNPVPVMKLVEVIRGYKTSDEVTRRVVELSHKLGKIPVEVQDYPGFISNRLLMPFINESIESLFQGVAGVREIDSIMKLGMAHPMGPLELADFIGLDVCLSILKVLHEGFRNPKYAPCPLLEKMVLAGDLGVKSGRGFYDYSEQPKAETVSEQFA